MTASLIILLPIFQKWIQIINCCPLTYINHHKPSFHSGKCSIVILACLKMAQCWAVVLEKGLPGSHRSGGVVVGCSPISVSLCPFSIQASFIAHITLISFFKKKKLVCIKVLWMKPLKYILKQKSKCGNTLESFCVSIQLLTIRNKKGVGDDEILKPEIRASFW